MMRAAPDQIKIPHPEKSLHVQVWQPTQSFWRKHELASSGGRKQSFRDLPQEEHVQLEEAFARATVAITRARSLCVITVYGAGQVWNGLAHFHLPLFKVP